MNHRDVAAALALCLLVPQMRVLPVAAHPAPDFYSATWQRDTAVELEFAPEFPSGAFRDRVVDGAQQWNAVGTPFTLSIGGQFSPNYNPNQCPDIYQTNGLF